MPKFGAYDDAGELDGSEVLVVKKGTATKRTTVETIAGFVHIPEEFFSGSDPEVGDGEDGDKWQNTESGDYFRREAGAWVLKGNNKGEPGDPGDPGDPGQPGDAGPAGSLFLGVTRWEVDDTRIGEDFEVPGLYRCTALADPEADPPVVEAWELIRSARPDLPYRDSFGDTETLTAADVHAVTFIYGTPANNAAVEVTVPPNLWPGPGLAPIYVQIGTPNPVKFKTTGATFRSPANGQNVTEFTVAAGSKYKWVNILTRTTIHRPL